MAAALTGETVELLQGLIRNACVNDGDPTSGQEVRNADLLSSYLGSAGLDVERFDAAPGRPSLVARIAGSDPEAASPRHIDPTTIRPVCHRRWVGRYDGRRDGQGRCY